MTLLNHEDVQARRAVEVEVLLPSLLRDSVQGADVVTARGATLRQALDDLLARHPLLRIHLYDESGATRKHVLIHYNGLSIALLETLDVPLSPGDELQIINAVSGG